MDKRFTLLPLLIAAAAGSANAQSVSIFGVVDVSLSHYSVAGGQKLNALADSNLNSSRLGFQGKEDLGGGLAASFWLEGALSPSDGSASGFNFMRRSTISLSGPWGEIRAGRDFTPTFWIDALYDPFGAAGIGTNLIQQVRSTGNIPGRAPFVQGWGANNLGFIRSSNAVSYYLPRNLGGFHGQIQYGFQEQSVQTLSPTSQIRFLGARAGYASGPLDISMALAHSAGAQSATTSLPKVETASLGASYKFPLATLSGAYLNESNTAYDSGAKYRLRGYLAGVAVPLGLWTFNASYARVTSNVAQSPTVDKWSLGYVYNLSKRTALYGTYARIGNRHGSMITVNGAVAGIANASSSGVETGIRHAF